MLTSKDNLNKFLETTSGQKEVNLIIAEDEAELLEFQKFLKSKGFTKVDRTAELLDGLDKPGKLFTIIQDQVNKNIYDFLAQYSSGQIEIFDHKQMQARIISPDYQNLSVEVIVTKKTLLALQAGGLDLLQYAGLAYQT